MAACGPFSISGAWITPSTDPLANPPRGLVLFSGLERRLLSHPDSPPPQAILEIRIQGSGLSIHGPSLRALPGSTHFHEVHRCGSFPSEAEGIRILNYLDDWLVLAQSEAKSLSHRALLLSHLECLGLRVNFAKSPLSPSQRVSFLGTVFDSIQMRAVVTTECALAIQQLAASFKACASLPLKMFQKLLGLMAAESPVLQLGLLHMRPLQYWLKPRVPSHVWHHGRLLIRVDQACVTALAPWTNVQWMEQAVPLGMVYRRKVVSTDASNTGWGVLCEGKPTFGHW